jgi:hypothetical protein
MIEIAIAAALISSAPFQAEDWRYGGGSPNVVLGYDHSSIRATGNTRTLSTIHVNARTETVAGTRFDYTVFDTTINCQARSMQNHQTDMYLFSSDAPVESYVRRDGAMTPVLGGPGAELMDAVCGDRTQARMPIRNGRNARTFALFYRVWLEAGNIR